MKAERTKFGLKHDYRGAHATYKTADGRSHLATIVSVFVSDGYAPMTWFKMRYFCGDDAPDCLVSQADILEREYA